MTSTSVARPGVADVTSIAATRTFYQNLAAALADDIVQIELALANLADLDLDEQTLDGFQSAQADADRAMRRCRATVAVLDTLHGGVEAAVQATPDAARIDFYQEAGNPGPVTRGQPVSDTAQEHTMTADQHTKASTEQSTSGPGAPVPTTPADAPATAPIPPTNTAKDPLKVGGKLVLRDGETFAGSTSTKDDQGYMLLAAAVDTPEGRTVHVAVPVHAEDKAEWKGAHAPAQETRLDPDSDPDDIDEDRFLTVDTNSDVTVVLDAADAAKLPEHAEEIITAAAQSDQEYRQLAKQSDRLYDERMRLETKRYGDTTDADLQMRLDSRESNHAKYQKKRRATMDEAADRLSPADRARYYEVQRRIEQAGADRFDPDKEEVAAAVCGVPVDDYRDLVELQKTPWYARTPEQHARAKQLDSDHLPPLLAEQAAIVRGLTLDEYRELEALDKIGRPHSRFGGRPGGRNPQQQARFEELCNAPGGATADTPRQTAKLRNQFETYQSAHHADKISWIANQQQREALTARARPLEPADAARLQQVIAEHDEVSDLCEKLGGEVIASVEVPGRTGTTLLVVEAVQREEEGGVDYLVDCKPANASEDWSAGGHDTYRTTAGGLRKLAKAVATVATPSPPASPAGQAFPRPPRQGVRRGDAAAHAPVGGAPQPGAQQRHHR